MNDQSQIMNQHQMLNQIQNQPQMSQMAPSQAPMVNQLSQPMIAQPQMMNQPKMMGPNYGQWSQPPPNMPLPPMNAMKFPNPMNQMYGGIAKPGRSSWKKGNKLVNKRKDVRWKDKGLPVGNGGTGTAVGGPSVGGYQPPTHAISTAVGGPSVGGYQPPTLHELEQQNRLRAKRFFHKKKFNRMGPYAHAPRNTTSYIIRAKKSGGIASLVSPCPVTPAVLPTPVFSPSREALVDMAKEEWGVDGYGSMKGLIRLRSPGHDEAMDDYDEEDEEGSSESDVEEHVEVERRLDHDLNRFEMIYPNSGVDYNNVLENRVDDQDTHIAQLEEENLILKERLYLMEREVGDLRRRLLSLERQNQVVEDINEEVVENVSENESEGVRSNPLVGSKHNEEVDFVPRNGGEDTGARRDGDSCDETMHKDSKERAMKEVIHCEAVDNNQEDEQVQEVNAVQKELHESGDNEAVGSAVEPTVDGINEGVKGEPFREVIAEEVNEH